MLQRTRFKKDIVAEFLPPKGRTKTTPVLILCSGMPSVPKARDVMEYWAAQGFFVFFPRYRGTWESGGEFLKRSPERDIRDLIDELPKGFRDIWSDKEYHLNPKRIYIIGGSFGGTAAILASRDPRITRAVAIAPVVNWRTDSSKQPKEKLGNYIPKAFGSVYRFSPKNWKRLIRGEFFNPVDEIGTIDGSKLLIFHAKNDNVVHYGPVKRFAMQTGATLVTLPHGGHVGLSDSFLPRFATPIKRFFRTG